MKAYFQKAAKINAKIAKAYRDGNLSKAADGHDEMADVCKATADRLSGMSGDDEPRDRDGNVDDVGGDLDGTAPQSKFAAEGEVKKFVVDGRDLTEIRKAIARPIVPMTAGGPIPGEDSGDALLEKIAEGGEEGEAMLTIAKAVNSLSSTMESFKASIRERMDKNRGTIAALGRALEELRA